MQADFASGNSKKMKKLNGALLTRRPDADLLYTTNIESEYLTGEITSTGS